MGDVKYYGTYRFCFHLHTSSFPNQQIDYRALEKQAEEMSEE